MSDKNIFDLQDLSDFSERDEAEILEAIECCRYNQKLKRSILDLFHIKSELTLTEIIVALCRKGEYGTFLMPSSTILTIINLLIDLREIEKLKCYPVTYSIKDDVPAPDNNKIKYAPHDHDGIPLRDETYSPF